MTWAGDLRARRMSPVLRDLETEYGDASGERDRERAQLQLLNVEWRRVVASSPYYAALCRERSIPDAFPSLETFAREVPVTRRSDVQTRGREMTCRGRPPDFLRTTGGSTSQPVQIPAWNGENRRTEPNTWLGRGWYGITPASRMFLIWGHSHLLGAGWARHSRKLERWFRDAMLGYTRFPAYDLRDGAMRSAATVLIRARPECVLGYSVALDRLARANADRREALRGAGVRLVVATAESFPSEDSATRLEDLFGCPVAMEYGAVETGVMAHTHPDGGFRFFWRSYLVEAAASAGGSALLVTSLYPRCFPLVRYEIGDEIVPSAGSPTIGLTACERILGRCNDYVVLSDGATIHSETFSHAFKPFPEIAAFQVVQESERLVIRFVGDRPLPERVEAAIRARLRDVHPALAAASFERRDALEQTVAGKTRMVIRLPST